MAPTVNCERVIDEPAKEVLRRQLWLTAEFCGLENLTCVILSNHLHVLVRVPQKVAPRAPELEARASRLAVVRPVWEGPIRSIPQSCVA